MVQNIGEGIDVNARIHHLDLKPTNIFLNEDRHGKWNGELVIGDFGIAENGSADHGCGTGGFASPEQIVTDACQEADIYSMAKGFLLTYF